MGIRRYELIWMFLLGCFVYSLLEILARGYTHWTMTLAGGVVGMLLYRLHVYAPPGTLWLQALCGCAQITALEMVVGVVVNLHLGWRVWDYGQLPLNLYGQICLPYAGVWFGVCLPALGICHLVRQHLFSKAEPQPPAPDHSSHPILHLLYHSRRENARDFTK